MSDEPLFWIHLNVDYPFNLTGVLYFPKIKQNIYTGDELFTKGEYEKAVSYYDRALNDPSKFRDKISSKLLNKKATALIKLEKYEDALKTIRHAAEVNTTNKIINENKAKLESCLKK